MGLVIATSVYKVRPGTLRSIDEFVRISLQNPELQVVVFNKTGSDLLKRDGPPNFKIFELLPEPFGETISRLEVDDHDYVIWCNDDDYFHFEDKILLLIQEIKSATVGLPTMSITAYSRELSIDWELLQTAPDIASRYAAYVIIGAPLIFSVLPGFVFNTWRSYIKEAPVKFPYFDTQLNVIALTAPRLELLGTHTYNYNAFNWEAQNQPNSLRVWTEELGLNPNVALSLDLCRNIENVVFIKSSDLCDDKKYQLLEVLLDQFYFMNTAQISMFSKNLRGRIFVQIFVISPSFIRRKLKMIYGVYFSSDVEKGSRNSIDLNLAPKEIRYLLDGTVKIHSLEQFEKILYWNDLHDLLDVPSSVVDFWRSKYEG